MQLTDKELRILKMVAGNMTTSEIAFALDIDDLETAGLMIGINEHFGTSDIRAAAEKAIERGEIDIEL